MKKSYPFLEGDEYFTIEYGRIVFYVWDDISEEMHDCGIENLYFRTYDEAVKHLENTQPKKVY